MFHSPSCLICHNVSHKFLASFGEASANLPPFDDSCTLSTRGLHLLLNCFGERWVGIVSTFCSEMKKNVLIETVENLNKNVYNILVNYSVMNITRTVECQVRYIFGMISKSLCNYCSFPHTKRYVTQFDALAVGVATPTRLLQYVYSKFRN